MFKCKCCPEKELRIAELKEQIQYFKNLLNPPPRINKYEMEETIVMNGGGDQVATPEDLEAEYQENLKIQDESDQILSGNFDVGA